MSASDLASFVERRPCIACGSSRLETLASRPFDEGLTGQFIAGDPWGENPLPFLRGRFWSLLLCGDCDMVYHERVLSPEWSERRYSRWMSSEAIRAFESQRERPMARFHEAIGNALHVLRLERLTRPVRGSARTKVLDFGCGYGSFVAMCNLFGMDAVGVDRSAAKRGDSDTPAIFASIEEIESTAPFHALTLFQVIEHLEQPRELLERLSSLLARGGVLVLEAPDCTGVRDIGSRADYDAINPLDHFNAFTPRTLQSLAHRLGYDRITRPAAMLSAGYVPIARGLVRNLLAPFRRATTELYFRKR